MARSKHVKLRNILYINILSHIQDIKYSDNFYADKQGVDFRAPTMDDAAVTLWIYLRSRR